MALQRVLFTQFSQLNFDRIVGVSTKVPESNQNNIVSPFEAHKEYKGKMYLSKVISEAEDPNSG